MREIPATCVLLILALLAPACTSRKGPTDEQLKAAQQASYERIKQDLDWFTEKTNRRLDTIVEEAPENGDDPPTYDVLILSGGGALGAFGAGFLHGWGQVEGEWARPEFDMVTGVSTGALMAPFAAIGSPESYETLIDFYSNPDAAWVVNKGIWPYQRAIFDVSRLHEFVRQQIDMDMIQGLAALHAQDRSLVVNSTNTDLGLPHLWDLTYHASQAVEIADPTRVQDALLASSAIPGAFPPVEIDGFYHVDGGASMMLFLAGRRDWIRDQIPMIPGVKPRFRMWVLINNKLETEPKLTQPRWTSVAARALTVLVRSSMLQTLRELEVFSIAANLRGDLTFEFRYAVIPEDFIVPEGKSMFDGDVMRQLVALGEEMGRDPKSWRTDAPDPELPIPEPMN